MKSKDISKSLVGEKFGYPDSLWSKTAISIGDLPQLRDNISTDVLIIGAGFTGLSAAIELATSGVSCVVVDACEPGWGASGRNNGQVIAGLKQDPDVIQSIYGGSTGENLIQFGSEAPGIVFDLIKKYQIDCNMNHSGWIQPAYSKIGEKNVRKRQKIWSDLGINTQLIEGSELHNKLGTKKYHIGWLDPRGGSVHPLNYAKGLAKVAIELGVSIFINSKIISLQKDNNGWLARNIGGSVKSRNIIIATGAYAENLIPGLKKSFVPVRTAQVASSILPLEIREQILPKHHVASDTRQLLTSFRLSPDGRLVMGGAGATAGINHSHIVPFLHKAGHDLFGHLGKISWEYNWSGYFAVTTDHLPHIHEPDENLHVALGCNGRGIAISTSMGKQLARRILSSGAEKVSVPITSIGKVKFYAFRGLGVKVATKFKRIQDIIS